MKIKTYKDQTLQVIDRDGRFYSPEEKIRLACDLTMKKVDVYAVDIREASHALIENLHNAEHHSIFEHSNITFLASGVSRSFLAQITRQGTFRFTSASQHYQDYRDYTFVLRPGWDNTNTDEASEIKEVYQHALNTSLADYIKLIELGEPPEEARQVLAPAASVNLLITANARNIARFLRARMCKRNVKEMRLFANAMHSLCLDWIPGLFKLVHAPCAMDGYCNQGKMSCGRPFNAL